MNSRKKKRPAIFAVAALLVLYSGMLFAQPSDEPDPEKVQEAIATTQQIIEQARSIVMESASQKARLMLEQAESMQMSAEGKLSTNSLRQSLNLTLEARQLAYQAIAIARQEMKAEGTIMRTIEETSERMAKVRDQMIEYDIRGDRAVKLLDEARNMLEKTRLNLQQHRYQLALKLAESARGRALQAEQYVNRIRSMKGTVERKLALLEKLKERAAERINVLENDQARMQLELVGEQVDQTRQLLNEHRYMAAKLSLENCEKTFRNLIRQFPSQNLNDPEVMLEESYRLLARAEEMLGSEDYAEDTERRGFIDEAKRLLTRAGDELAENRNESALRLINEARALLRLATSDEGGEMTKEEVRSQIERIEAMGDDVAGAVEGCDAPGVRMLLDRAAARLAKARQFLDEGELPNAEAEARIARNLYQRVREICGSL
ncbi:MAG TPA: hypothetical protein ENO08_04365 [Candidatus Eisenbacteria bacterium]|uniref:Uncharacterized protein n=1 Tax=Eiseniibacteriota bacterium TaxID=2212470 RepID=A0A7V2AUT5_UNCEI|nr:hypothetical protein [Candidatus Eisenbacteria bacterium]